MKTIIAAILMTAVFVTAPAHALDREAYDALVARMDSARALEVPVFAPKTWEKATKAFEDANQRIELQRDPKSIDEDVSKAREYVENAVKAAEVARLSLQEYLGPRQKALEARAPALVPELYQKAEEKFIKATEKVESGDVKGGLKEADKSTPLFDTAELEAIRVDILGKADALIEKARVDEADKYALTTLDKARTARQKADAILTADRYNRDESVEHARRAEYEALHASNIAQSVRSLNRNDQAWEKLMLVYEIQMNRVGEQIGLEHLPFDDGPLAAADTLIAYIGDLQARNAHLSESMTDLSGTLTSQLEETLGRFDVEAPASDPVTLAESIDRQVANLIVEKTSLAGQLETNRTKMSQLRHEAETVAERLSTRIDREEKFKKAKQMFNPAEGEVLFNASNDIVLRLSGLSFDVGRSEIKDDHVPLLEKVEATIEMFPDSRIRIEGHTDASGDAARNIALSEKRALAVMQYLRQSMLLPAERISSVGYGSDRPVAPNQTADGRAKNRRIDIVIMQ